MNTIPALGAGGSMVPPPSPRAPEGPRDEVLLGDRPAVDLRTAMRALERAADPPPRQAEVVWSTDATHFAFRAMVSPRGNVVEAGNERRFSVHGPEGGFLKGESVPEGPSSVTPAFRPDGGFYVCHGKGLRSYSPEGNLLWERDADGARGVAAGPEGNGYVESPLVLQAFSADGQPLWDHVRTYPGRGDGPLVSPDGTVITVEGDDSLLALNPDGSDRWRYTGLRQGRYGPGALSRLLSPPAMGPDGSLYLLTRDGDLKQVDPDGHAGWSVRVGGPSTWSRPVAVDGQGNVFVQGGEGNGTLFAFDRDGKELFRRPCRPAFSMTGIPGGGVAVSGNEGLVGLDLDGRPRWSFATDNRMSVSPPTWAPDGTMRVGASHTLYALRLPPMTDDSPAVRLLATLESAPPVPEVLQGDDGVTIGEVWLPRNG